MTVGAGCRSEVVFGVHGLFGPTGSGAGWHQSGAEAPWCGEARGDCQCWQTMFVLYHLQLLLNCVGLVLVFWKWKVFII